MNWRTIRGHDAYAVSDTGEVKRTRRGKGTACTTLKGIVNPSTGYVVVNLYDGTGTSTTHYVHRLVLQAFTGGPEGRQCNHIDGDRQNNRLDNLEWCTAAENNRDARAKRPPQYATGDAVHTTKLTPPDVVQIRTAVERGASMRSQALAYGIDHKTVSAIVHRRTWAWV